MKAPNAASRNVKSSIVRALLWGCAYVAIAVALLGANPFRGETTGPFDLLVSYPGWSLEDEPVTVRNTERSDVLDALLPPWMESRRQLRQGVFPLWDPLRAGGRPALFDPTSAQLTVGFAIFAAVPDPALGFYLSVLANLVIAGLGMHLLVARYCRAGAALFAGFSYMACGFITAWLYWPHTHTAIWIPWLLLAVGSFVAGGSARALAGIALATALMFLGGFPFVVAIGLGAALVHAALSVARHDWRTMFARFGGVLAGIGLGLALVAVPLLTLWAEFSGLDLSYRSGGSPLNLETHRQLLLLPWAGVAPRVESNMYVGMAAMLLALFGLVGLFKRDRNPLTWTGVAFFMIGAILAFGILPKEIGLHLPVLSNNPWNRAILLMDIGLILLAAVGMDRLTTRIPWRAASLAAVALICAVQGFDLGRQFRKFNGATPAEYFYPLGPGLAKLAKTIGPFQFVGQDSSFFPFSGSLGAIGLGDWFSHSLRSPQLHNLLDAMADQPFTSPTATGIVVNDYHWPDDLMDVVGFCYAVFPNNAAGRELLSRSVGRTQVALPPINNLLVTQPFTIPKAANVSAVAIKLATYRAMDVDGQLTAYLRSGPDRAEIARATLPAAAVFDNSMATFVFAPMPRLEAGSYELALRYVPGPRKRNLTAWLATDVPGQVRRGDAAVPGSLQYAIFGPPDGSFTVLAEEGGFSIAKNTDCVDGAYWTADLTDPLSTRRQATVRLKQYRPDRFLLESKAATPGFLIVPMQYQPGWQAQVDGRPARIRLIKGVLPAVAIPSGTATVAFAYQPPRWRLGLFVSAIALLVLVGLWIIRRKTSQTADARR